MLKDFREFAKKHFAICFFAICFFVFFLRFFFVFVFAILFCVCVSLFLLFCCSNLLVYISIYTIYTNRYYISTRKILHYRKGTRETTKPISPSGAGPPRRRYWASGTPRSPRRRSGPAPTARPTLLFYEQPPKTLTALQRSARADEVQVVLRDVARVGGLPEGHRAGDLHEVQVLVGEGQVGRVVRRHPAVVERRGPRVRPLAVAVPGEHEQVRRARRDVLVVPGDVQVDVLAVGRVKPPRLRDVAVVRDGAQGRDLRGLAAPPVEPVLLDVGVVERRGDRDGPADLSELRVRFVVRHCVIGARFLGRHCSIGALPTIQQGRPTNHHPREA